MLRAYPFVEAVERYSSQLRAIATAAGPDPPWGRAQNPR
jgi:hypothetical protein